jgi:hypothetical protein
VSFSQSINILEKFKVEKYKVQNQDSEVTRHRLKSCFCYWEIVGSGLNPPFFWFFIVEED